MLSLSGLPQIDLFQSGAAERHHAARDVRVLPQVAPVCCLKNFVELWSIISRRKYSAEFLAAELALPPPPPPSLSSPSAAAAAAADDDEDHQQQHHRPAEKNPKRRRSGEAVFKALPFAIVVRTAMFLQHHPLMEFSIQPSDRYGGGIREIGVGSIVEEAVFDMSRVVSFYLRFALNGKVIPTSRFFINPNMIVGVEWPSSRDGADDGDDDAASVKSGCLLFDMDLSKLRGRVSDQPKLKSPSDAGMRVRLNGTTQMNRDGVWHTVSTPVTGERFVD